jgi:ABC-type cobalamin transport system ATPase subunit
LGVANHVPAIVSQHDLNVALQKVDDLWVDVSGDFPDGIYR